jgi:molecular chaperone GrpE
MKDKKQEEAKVEAAETPADNEEVKAEATADNAAADAGAEAGAGGEKPAEPDWKTLYAITLADFDNYKKRAARDREDVYRYAESDILKDVLPSVDNLALALDKAADKEDPFVKGVQLVYDTLLKALEGHGAKPMENPLGKELDPNFHEAIATLPNEEYEEGRISNIVKTGWMLNDKLLRAAQVVVSAGKSNG